MNHGKLYIRGTDGPGIPGTFNYEESGSFSFTADGATFGTFFNSSEWRFVLDPPPKPQVWLLVASHYDEFEVVGAYTTEELAVDAKAAFETNPPTWAKGMWVNIEVVTLHGEGEG